MQPKPTTSTASLAALESRLRALLPADLYATAWVDPSSPTLQRVFEHLRTLQSILYDYMPRQVAETLPNPGEVRHEWQRGTLMFTDLAGFTPLMEANAALGQAGARTLLKLLNQYFGTMLEILGKSGGNLLEFTGDAMLVQFPGNPRQNDTATAVRAGLRMQRAMSLFQGIQIGDSTFNLGMRVGIHTGRFFTAEIGTPFRMEHVLLGGAVHHTKQAEGNGRVGRVNLTLTAHERVKDLFRFEPGNPEFMLVVDDLTAEQLGEYEFAPGGRRLPRALLLDRSVPGLLAEIEGVVRIVEPLASYLPRPVLNLIVENAAKRQIPPDFPEPTLIFVNLVGLPESVDRVLPDEEDVLAASFSRAFGLINAAVEARGGILKKVTCQVAGSDMMICFGVPSAHTDDPVRACEAALVIRDVINRLQTPTIGGEQVVVHCQIGLARGPIFSAEIGEPRGRREFNVLGDPVNTAARLMGKAARNQILMTHEVYERVQHKMDCEPLGAISLKGKAAPVPLFALQAVKPT
jgi:class 3 adenylate cyclase